MQMPLVILGIVVYVIEFLINREANSIYSAVFGLVAVLTHFVYVRRNRANQHKLSVDWGVNLESGIQSKEIRGAYEGNMEFSDVDGSATFSRPEIHTIARNSASLLLSLITFGLICILLFYVNSFETTFLSGTGLEGSFSSLVIVVLNKTLEEWARWVTELESPKTDDKFEATLIPKVVLFRFATGFGILYYRIFFMEYIEGNCGAESCIIGARHQLRGILFGMLFLNNITEIGKLKLFKFLRTCRESAAEIRSRSSPQHYLEKQCNMEEYHDLLDDIDETMFRG
jgi:hypothetical protein